MCLPVVIHKRGMVRWVRQIPLAAGERAAVFSVTGSIRSCCSTLLAPTAARAASNFEGHGVNYNNTLKQPQSRRWRSRWGRKATRLAKEQPGYQERLAAVSGLLVLNKAKHVESSRMVQRVKDIWEAGKLN